MKVVNRRWARLLLGWVTARRQIIRPGMGQNPIHYTSFPAASPQQVRYKSITSWQKRV